MYRVIPFGNPRIKACCQLPEAYRRLPRPSSPPIAKAFTVYAYSLSHITSNDFNVYENTIIPLRYILILYLGAFIYTKFLKNKIQECLSCKKNII